MYYCIHIYMHIIYDSIPFFYNIYISTFLFFFYVYDAQEVVSPSGTLTSKHNFRTLNRNGAPDKYALFMYTPCGKIVY